MKPGPKPRRKEIHITMGYHPAEYAEIKSLATYNGVTFHEQVRMLTRFALDVENAIMEQALRVKVRQGVLK